MHSRQLIGRRGERDRIRTGVRGLRPGVTLTETVVASALLLIAIVPILKALTVAQVTNRAIQRKTQSLMLAQRELDRIKARSIYHYDDCFAETSRVLGEGFLYTVADDEDPSVRLITLSVGLDLNKDSALAPDEVEVSLSTYLARRWPGP